MNTIIEHQMWHVKPLEFPNAEEYVADIYDITQASTGFVHAWESNLFFEEAAQLLVNSIRLFQLGYFDCAFFSLRQSLELSVGTIFLTENPDKKRDWLDLKNGFESGRMHIPVIPVHLVSILQYRWQS